MALNIPVRVRHLVERECTSDPARIAKSLKCRVLYCDLPRHVNGMWRRILRRKYIFVNSAITEEWQQKAIIAHELGHIILHPTYRAYSINGISFQSSHREDEANEFASLLMNYGYPADEYYTLQFLENGWRS